MSLTVSDPGRAFITREEGKRNKAYRDSRGILTIGVGHTSSAGPPIVTPTLYLDDANVDAVFKRDLGQYETAVDAACDFEPSQQEFDALVSLCYNIGPGAFEKRCSLVKYLDDNDTWDQVEIVAHFVGWAIPASLLGRRHREAQLFINGVY